MEKQKPSIVGVFTFGLATLAMFALSYVVTFASLSSEFRGTYVKPYLTPPLETWVESLSFKQLFVLNFVLYSFFTCLSLFLYNSLAPYLSNLLFSLAYLSTFLLNKKIHLEEPETEASAFLILYLSWSTQSLMFSLNQINMRFYQRVLEVACLGTLVFGSAYDPLILGDIGTFKVMLALFTGFRILQDLYFLSSCSGSAFWSYVFRWVSTLVIGVLSIYLVYDFHRTYTTSEKMSVPTHTIFLGGSLLLSLLDASWFRTVHPNIE